MMVQSAEPTTPQALLTKFAKMAEKSKTPDGDWQGDGWGITWLDENNQWQVQKSLKPVWENTESFRTFPTSSLFVVHARSASFSQHKGVIKFNQPYVTDQYAFVFNGLLKGVSIPNVPGHIGAEKIWHLLQQNLKKYKPQQALEKLRQFLVKNSRKIVAINIGLASKNKLYTLNYYTQEEDYYCLHQWSENSTEIISSELFSD